jgi:hypothetical protein
MHLDNAANSAFEQQRRRLLPPTPSIDNDVHDDGDECDYADADEACTTRECTLSTTTMYCVFHCHTVYVMAFSHTYDTLPAPNIDMSQLEFVSVLGNGQFADVHLCRFNKKSQETMVAVKQMHANSVQDFMLEAHTMAKLRHRHIVRVLGVCAKTAPYAIVTEYMCNGDVNQYMLNNSTTIRYCVTFAYCC